MKQKLVFATNNKNKLNEIRSIIKERFDILSLEDIGCFEDIEETGKSLEENSYIKAKYVKDKYGYDCFADDTGLEVDVLDGRPGIYSARYAGDNHDSEANIKKLLKDLEGEKNRVARFRTVITLILDNQIIKFEGLVNGKILEEKTNGEGFGYDPIFMPEGENLSFAQLGIAIKNKISHRSKATEQLCSYLTKKNDK